MVSPSFPEICRIAVLMTCYNRRETTLKCLDAIKDQEELDDGIYLQIYLVDDGCTDGTNDAVQNKFPEIIVIKGNGNLYWNGGMRVAWKEAMKLNYDYYLWLNDDSSLKKNALSILLSTADLLLQETSNPCIVAGSMRDTYGSFSYGGRKQRCCWHPLGKLDIVIPSDIPQPCDVINGNCVLVPDEIVRVVGILSTDFTHGMGDYDYSLRAKRLGFSSWIAPGYVGICLKNSFSGTCYDPLLPISERTALMASPTGLPPAREWMIFTKRHGGWFWPLFWLRTLVRIYLPQLWIFMRTQKTEVATGESTSCYLEGKMEQVLLKLKRLTKVVLGKDFFLKPDLLLSTETFGTDYGGWTIVSDVINEDSIVYSFGVGEDA